MPFAEAGLKLNIEVRDQDNFDPEYEGTGPDRDTELFPDDYKAGEEQLARESILDENYFKELLAKQFGDDEKNWNLSQSTEKNVGRIDAKGEIWYKDEKGVERESSTLEGFGERVADLEKQNFHLVTFENEKDQKLEVFVEVRHGDVLETFQFWKSIKQEKEQFPFRSLEEVSKSLDWSGGDWEKTEESKESQVLKKADKLTFAKTAGSKEKIEVQTGTVSTSQLHKEVLENLHAHGYATAEAPETRQIFFADKNGKVSFEVYRQKPKELLGANDGPDDDVSFEKDIKQPAASPIRTLDAKAEAETHAITLEVKSSGVLGKQGRNKAAERPQDVIKLQKIFTIAPKHQPEQTSSQLAEDEALDYDENDNVSLRKQSPVRQESQKPGATLGQHEAAPIFEPFLALDAIEAPAAIVMSAEAQESLKRTEASHLRPALEEQSLTETFGISLNTAETEAGLSIIELSGKIEAVGNNIEEAVVDDLDIIGIEDAALPKTAVIDTLKPLQAISIIETDAPDTSADQEAIFTAESAIPEAIDFKAELVFAPINEIGAEQEQSQEIAQPIIIEQTPAASFKASAPSNEKAAETTFRLENSSESGIVLMEDGEASALKGTDNLKAATSPKPAITKDAGLKGIAPTKIEFVQPAAKIQEARSGIEIVGQDPKLDDNIKETGKIETPKIVRPIIPQIRKPGAALKRRNKPEPSAKTFTRTEPQPIKIDVRRNERQVNVLREVREIDKPVVKSENLKISATDKKEVKTSRTPFVAGTQRASQKQPVRLTPEAQRLTEELTALSKLSNRPSPARSSIKKPEIPNRAINYKPAAIVQDKEEAADNNQTVYERELALAA